MGYRYDLFNLGSATPGLCLGRGTLKYDDGSLPPFGLLGLLGLLSRLSLPSLLSWLSLVVSVNARVG
jgi:hypothetical protein